MKKEFLLIVFFAGLMIQAISQNLNSGLSSPVVLDTKNPVVEVISPNGGETVEIGQSITIYWNASDEHLSEFPVKIGFSTIYGGLPVWLEESFSNADTATVLLPQEETYFARVFVKVTDAFGNTTTDESNGYFTIISGCNPAFADAGQDATICENASHFLIDATAENYSLVSWTTTGDGTFNDETIVNPTYTPGAGDIAVGWVNLCLIAEPIIPCTLLSDDCMTIVFQSPPTAYAGHNDTICYGNSYTFSDATAENYSWLQWYTINGGGGFDNETLLHPTYYPSAAIDYAQQCIIIGVSAQAINPCVVAAEDFMDLCFIEPPSINAGEDRTVCADVTTVSMAGYSIGGGATTGAWSGGAGSWAGDEYTPTAGEIAAGSVELTYCTTDAAPCENVCDYMTVTFQPLPTANAGADATITENPEYTLSDASALNYSTITWTTNGDGTFDNSMESNTVYHAGPVDLENQCVNLYLTAHGYSPCGWFNSTQDTIQLCFIKLVTNVAPTQRTDGSKMVDIFYDLTSLKPSYNITAEVSFEGNGNYIQIDSVSGDVGTNVTPGVNKHIIWDASYEAPGVTSDNAIFRITANNEVQWKCGEALIDTRDNQSYSTVQIGTQCWMKQNLNIGTQIDGLDNQTNNGIIEKYCYSDSIINCNVYGGMYQWNEIMQYSISESTQGICPSGWHLPANSEWSLLTTYLGGDNIAGGKMKEVGTSYWWQPNFAATNSSGFTGLPSGIRSSNGSFDYLGGVGFFWSTSEDEGQAWITDLISNGAYVYRGSFPKDNGLSVRCLRDNSFPINQPPNTPNSPSPETGSISQPLNTTLTWNCTDPENDPLTYDVYFGAENPPTMVLAFHGGAAYNPGLLASNTSYFWKIVAHDDQGNASEGPVWSFTTQSFTIGQSYGGGIIFYIDGTGQHGLISATYDQAAWVPWGCKGITIGGTSVAIGSGQSNTNAFVNGCNEEYTAGRICFSLSINGYDDWFLPSIYELDQMYSKRTLIGGFIDSYYWSSSEVDSDHSYIICFCNGVYYYQHKDVTYHTRAIRSF